MKRVKCEERRPPNPLLRVLRFWTPVFLFGYFIFTMLVLAFLPVRGPLAAIGHIVPVPVGLIDGRPFWYYQVLATSNVFKSEGASLDSDAVQLWTVFFILADSFADTYAIPESESRFFGSRMDLSALHARLLEAGNAARASGAYQPFAQQRVDQIQGLIDLGIFFQDLAYQYTELPKEMTNGVRTLALSQVPEEYLPALDSSDPVLVETDGYYVFVRLVPLSSADAFDPSYRVIELGIAKQSIRETFYAYLRTHSIRWF